MALALGMTVRELLSRVDSRELAEWVAYNSIDPIGNFRSDLQSGIVASTIANVNRGKNTNPFSPQDFMPVQETKSKVSSEEEMMATMMRATQVFNRDEK